MAFKSYSLDSGHSHSLDHTWATEAR